MGNEKKLTNGKFEGIVHISDENGLFKILATDQRGSLRRIINPDNPKAVTAEELKEVKLALITCEDSFLPLLYNILNFSQINKSKKVIM